MENAKKTAVIYARQSSGAEDVSESVEMQISNCEKLAKKEGITIIGIFKDLNTSGKTYPTGAESTATQDTVFLKWFNQQTGNKMYRQGLGEALARLPEISHIIVDDATRLYRPVTGSYLENYINSRLNEYSVTVLQVKGQEIDLSRFDQRLIQMLRNQINDEQIANQKKKSMDQLKKRRDTGLLSNGGGRAFATRYNVVTKQIEVIDAEAEVVEYVFNEIEKYTPYLQIIKAINQRWKHLFKRCFYESNLYHIAKNPIYAGYMYNSDGMLIKNVQIVKNIITFEQWQKVQNIMKAKKKQGSKAKYRWLPFSGLLYCGNCGSKLVSQCDKTGVYYLCNAGSNYKQSQDCRHSRVVMTCQKEYYVGLKEAIAPLLIMSLFKMMDDTESKQQDRKELEKLRVDLANMEQKKQTLTGLFLKGLLSESDLEKGLSEHINKMKDLQSKITIADSMNNADETTKHFQSVYKKFTAEKFINGELDNSDYETALKETVQRIDLFETEAKIQTVYGSFILPRYLVKNHRNFPVPELIINGKTAEKMTCIIKYKTGKKGVLATFPKIRIETI